MKRLGRRGTVVPFVADAAARGKSVGRVHEDGSISFKGKRFGSIRELPSECTALRADVATYALWAKLYKAVDPKRKRSG
ncbi:MAG: hypothetical protein ACM3JH_06295 [Acidithiobacillales bacterium]